MIARLQSPQRECAGSGQVCVQAERVARSSPSPKQGVASWPAPVSAIASSSCQSSRASAPAIDHILVHNCFSSFGTSVSVVSLIRRDSDQSSYLENV